MLDTYTTEFAAKRWRNASSIRTVLWFRAETVGCRVPQRSRRGRVAVVFDRACIVEMVGGGVVAVLASGVGNVAHGIRMFAYGDLRQNLRSGSLAVLDSYALNFDNGKVALTFATTPIWRSRFRLGMVKPNFTVVEEDLRLRYLLSQHSASNGSSEFLAATLSPGSRTTQLAARIVTILPRLALAAQRRDLGVALNGLRQLIGLGTGLTPAGDDFIIGWLAGMALTARSAEEVGFVRAAAKGIESMCEGTTLISQQHIADACAFQFSEHLSELCIALSERAQLPILASRLAAQLAVGATSGADAAAGLAFALRVCATLSQTDPGRRY